jgi:hypothetical protein
VSVASVGTSVSVDVITWVGVDVSVMVGVKVSVGVAASVAVDVTVMVGVRSPVGVSAPVGAMMGTLVPAVGLGDGVSEPRPAR